MNFNFDQGLFDLKYREAKTLLVRAFERAYAEEMLLRARGVQVKAANMAGLERSNFRRLLKRKR